MKLYHEIGVLSPNRRKFQTAPFHANSQSIPAKTASRSIGSVAKLGFSSKIEKLGP